MNVPNTCEKVHVPFFSLQDAEEPEMLVEPSDLELDRQALEEEALRELRERFN